MVKQPEDNNYLALLGLLNILIATALGLGALFAGRGDRSLLGALAFLMIVVGAAQEYVGHRGQVGRAVRRRSAHRRNHA